MNLIMKSFHRNFLLESHQAIIKITPNYRFGNRRESLEENLFKMSIRPNNFEIFFGGQSSTAKLNQTEYYSVNRIRWILNDLLIQLESP